VEKAKSVKEAKNNGKSRTRIWVKGNNLGEISKGKNSWERNHRNKNNWRKITGEK
jgi:hypothetical protein